MSFKKNIPYVRRMEEYTAKYLVCRLSLGTLEVSVPPQEPFLTIPAVVGISPDGDLFYGEDALAKRNELELSTVSGVPLDGKRNFQAFFTFVFRRREVMKRQETGLTTIVILPYGFSESRLVFRAYNFGSCFHESIENKRFAYMSANFLGRCVGQGSRTDTVDTVCINAEADYIHLMVFQDRVYYAQASLLIGFDHICNFFLRLLCEKGYSLTSDEGQIICRELVKKYCYVAMDVDAEIERVESLGGVLHEVTLDDGVVIELGTECFMAPEVLFNPGLIGVDIEQSIAKVYAVILTSSTISNPTVCRFVGTFLPNLAGFKERLQHDAEAHNPLLRQREFRLSDSTLNEGIIGYACRNS